MSGSRQHFGIYTFSQSFSDGIDYSSIHILIHLPKTAKIIHTSHKSFFYIPQNRSNTTDTDILFVSLPDTE